MVHLVKVNYKYEKRQKEIEKKRKKEQKIIEKQQRKEVPSTETPPAEAPQTPSE